LPEKPHTHQQQPQNEIAPSRCAQTSTSTRKLHDTLLSSQTSGASAAPFRELLRADGPRARPFRPWGRFPLGRSPAPVKVWCGGGRRVPGARPSGLAPRRSWRLGEHYTPLQHHTNPGRPYRARAVFQAWIRRSGPPRTASSPGAGPATRHRSGRPRRARARGPRSGRC